MENTAKIPVPCPQSMLPAPPCGPIEIVFSFDTTGSMSECLDRVRAQLAYVIQRLTADIPGLRIAVFAHGDYCDEHMYGYVTKYVDFTNDVTELCRFVSEVSATGGGDFEECYELVLRQVRDKLSWQPGTQRALVMIGDATPHEVDSEQNVLKINWREEAHRLITENGTHIYAVQCLNNSEADEFYRHLAESTGGKHLKLDELSNIVDMMMAVCYRERGAEFFEAYEMEVRQRDGAGMRADLDRMFATLKDGAEAGSSCPSITDPVPSCSYDPQPSCSGITNGIDDVSIDDVIPATDDGASDISDGPVPPPGWIPLRRRHRSGSLSSSRTTGSTGRNSTGSNGNQRKRMSTIMTRSKRHPMTLRHQEMGKIADRLRKVEDMSRKSRKKHQQQKQTPRKIKRIIREKYQGLYFPLQDLKWSRWQKAISPDVYTRVASDKWEPRPDDHQGERKKKIFGNKDLSPAVYELAVQPPHSHVKTPVFGVVTNGFGRSHWESKLLSQPHIQRSVDDVVKRGCRVHLRRAHVPEEYLSSIKDRYLDLHRKYSGKVTPKPKNSDKGTSTAQALKELRKYLTMSCDYAWSLRRDDATKEQHPRTLVKREVYISGKPQPTGDHRGTA